MQFKLRAQRLGVASIETVLGELLLFRQADLPVGLVLGPADVVDALDVLQERADAFEAVGDFDRDGVQVDAAALLEVSELGNLQTVEQHLPADAPGAERGRFPVVFLEANVVRAQVDADGSEAAEVQILNIGRRGLQDHLILKMLVEPIGVFAVATVGGPTGWLHVADAIGCGTEDAEKSFRVHGAGADLGVVGLLEDAALLVPVMHELEDKFLKSESVKLGLGFKFYFSCHEDS